MDNVQHNCGVEVQEQDKLTARALRQIKEAIKWCGDLLLPITQSLSLIYLKRRPGAL